MSDLIDRQAAIDEIDEWIKAFRENGHKESAADACLIQDGIIQIPSAQPERKKGKWEEKHHAYSDEESVIEEWQSCRCSECGRYDTRPYMYYFNEPNYCSYCGADMRGEGAK